MITCENVVNIVQNSRRMKWKWSSRKQTTKTVGITTAVAVGTTTITTTVVTTAKQSECAQKYAAITATPAKQLRCQSVYVSMCESSFVCVCLFATVSVCVSDLYLCVCVCISSCSIRIAFNFVALAKKLYVAVAPRFSRISPSAAALY